MKEEHPLLFKAICTEIYNDLNIKDISYPTWKHEYMDIYYTDGRKEWTTKGDLDGWIFNNHIRLNIEDLYETERKFKELEFKSDKP